MLEAGKTLSLDSNQVLFATSYSSFANSATPLKTDLNSERFPLWETAKQPRSSLLFIDSRVSDLQSLLAGIDAPTEIHILDSSESAIAQITQTLLGRSNVSSLHIVSHGQAGSLADWLTLQTLDRYADPVRSWAKSLTEDADILLYGCNIASGEMGQTFVQQFANLTGADLAASEDLTGSARLGGDWDLEFKTGEIESAIAFDSATLAAYEQILPVMLPGYQESFYANTYAGWIGGLTIDLATNTLYFTDDSGQGNLFKITPDRNTTFIASNFAPSSSPATDLEFVNGSVYAVLANRNLVQANTTSGAVQNLRSFPSAGFDAGLTSIGNKFYLTSGSTGFGSGNILEYELGSDTFGVKIPNLPPNASSLEFDPLRNKFYFTIFESPNSPSGIYQADAATGAVSRLAALPQGNGNFAIDPTGEYLYVRSIQGEVIRVSTTNGSSSVFQTGVWGNGDLVFGRSSSGTGGSLYLSAGSNIIEVSGFAAPIVQSSGTGIYTQSVFVDNLWGERPGSIAYDRVTRSLYFTGSGGSGLYKVGSDRVVSTVNNDVRSYSDLQIANGAIYLTQPNFNGNGHLVQINPNTGTAVRVSSIPGSGFDAGLAANAGKILVATPETILQEYDLASGMSRIKMRDLPQGVATLEFDPVQNKYYFSRPGGEFYVADPTTNTISLLTTISGATQSNFAIDPSGQYLYTRVGGDVLRISTTTGVTSVFQSGLTGNELDTDFAFGISSSGVGGSLYISDGSLILEVSGFATPPMIPGSYAATGIYNYSLYAEQLNSMISNLEIDPATGTLYFTDRNPQGILGRVNRDRTISTIANNFADNSRFLTSELQFANGFIYTVLENGNLIQINPSNGGSTVVANFPEFGQGSGLALEPGKILISSGAGFGGIQEYDLSAGTSSASRLNLFSNAFNLEYDPNKDRYYFSFASSIFVANPSTGRVDSLTNLSSGFAGSFNGNFAIDPFGEYLYTKIGRDIVRVSTLNGQSEVFLSPKRNQFGFDPRFEWSDYNWGTDLVFGAASSGNGYSLYLSDNDRIFEISGFPSTALTNTASSNTQVNVNAWNWQVTEGSTTQFALSRSDRTGTLVVDLELDPRSTANLSDVIFSIDTEGLAPWLISPRISINGSIITVTMPEEVQFMRLNARTVDDRQIEGRESLGLRIVDNPARYISSSSQVAYIEVIDNDFDRVAIAAINSQIYENGGASSRFRISRTLSNTDLTVTLDDFNSTAYWSDYTWALSAGYSSIFGSALNITLPQGVLEVDLIITPINDGISEGAEIIRLNLAQGNDYTIDPVNNSATITILEEPRWILAATADFDGDNKADLLWRSSVNGELVFWKMNGANLVSYTALPYVAGLQWQIQGAADFDGDTKTDLLWRHSATGEMVLWKMNGINLVNYQSFPSVANLDWQVQAIADFDGDRKVDLLWRNLKTGESLLWKMNGTTLMNYWSFPSVSNLNWQVQAAADFDGDGKTDLLWRNTVTGENLLWKMDGSTLVSYTSFPSTANLNWQIQEAIDLDGDGLVDLLWRNSLTGELLLWKMNYATLNAIVPVNSI